jgi:hypothetical protein
VDAIMNKKGSFLPSRPPVPPGAEPSERATLTAIGDLADYVRAFGLQRADELLTELLAILHAGPIRPPRPGRDRDLPSL